MELLVKEAMLASERLLEIGRIGDRPRFLVTDKEKKGSSLPLTVVRHIMPDYV